MQALLGWLTLIAPLALAVLAAALVWRKVTRPLLFLCVAVFAVLAIQAVVLLFIAGRLPPGEPNAAYLQIGGLVAALVTAIACPLLWLLYRGLRHAGGTVEGA